ncbi:diaminopimelate epimerase [Christensenellaceae bacterium OttesenSCG-928-K19]|nr:diaminopimelate epimerase [Christensenellaceae bacterium OttesenSCG-928-K19]
MKITKMHGLGNDFILTEEVMPDYSTAAQALCARRLSVGADGLVVVSPSTAADVRMRIFNADGSEAEMCGNAIRCFARYVHDRGIVKTDMMTVETLAGIMKPQLLLEDGAVVGVRVDMGRPELAPEKIPVLTDTPLDFEVTADGRRFNASIVLMGVPHTVLLCDGLDEIDIEKIGSEIETNPLFPRKTNVNFAEVTAKDAVRVRTWERGAGRTLACGTGACATGVIARAKGLVDDTVKILVEAGELLIENMPDGRVFMTGPAAYVFEGVTL